jgi:ABC-2 type transport system permease protein
MSWGTLQWRLAALKNGFQDATAYRIEFFLEILGSALVPATIQLVLWYAIFKIGGNTEISGLTYNELIQYTMASVLFSQIRGGDHDFELQEMIRSGQLSNYLLRPVSVVEFVYIRGVAPRLLVAGISLGAGILIGPYFGVAPERMIGATLMALIGNIIHYQIGSVLATTAFFWEEAYSVLMIKNMIVGLLSGEMLHLGLFPESMQWIWKATPFYLYVFGPTEYALGKWTHQEFLGHLAIGFAWMAVGWAAIRLSWGLTIRRYLSLGG